MFERLSRYNPDLYTPSDARGQLSKIKDPKYLLDTEDVSQLDLNKGDITRVWSLPPAVFMTIRDIVKNAGHVHTFPFILGTYEMNSRKMTMNDFCLTDPYMAYLIATGGLEGFAMPFLRGLYYAGRSSWWRHESIHARHHHQMAYFLAARDKEEKYSAWFDREKMQEAMYTVHESGIEELVTRWQAVKESSGLREKAVSALALLFYMEYAPFTGVRNAFIDAKESTLDLIQDGRLRVPAKIATVAAITLIPPILNTETQAVESLGSVVSEVLPVTSQQVESLVSRGHVYIIVAALSAMFSSKEKGVFDKKRADGERLPTTEYKFPYVYNPVTSTTRSISFLRYLSKVWDQIPNYRLIESPKNTESIKKEVDERVSAKLSDKQYQFTMKALEDALAPFEKSRRSKFPQDAYIKGMFLPALYIRLKEMYP